jgi:hypothetical protein
MSKFHEGDKVRIAPNARLGTSHKLKHGDVGVVRTVDDGLDLYPYIVSFVVDGEPVNEGFGPTELRPADIFALETGDPVWLIKREGGDETQVDDTIHVQQYVVGEAVDSVNHPAHYTRFPVEVINFTEQLDFNRGNAVKYIARAGFKEGVDELEDLSKAAWYINRAIEKLKSERAGQV